MGDRENAKADGGKTASGEGLCVAAGGTMDDAVAAADAGSSRASAKLPPIHVISDSAGITAQVVARAAAAQFDVPNPPVEIISRVTDFPKVAKFLDEHAVYHEHLYGSNELLIFYTLSDPELCQALEAYVAEHDNITAVDLLSAPIAAMAKASGLVPSGKPGGIRRADDHYFKRIEALEFTIAHDDGRKPEDLTKADIVLIGVSRSSKTPTSIYLSQQGYKVANVPLDPSTEPPKQLLKVERSRLFGLMTSPEVLVNIRARRLGKAIAVADNYANPDYVYEDLEKARALMRQLGCIVVHTENRAVEEVAQEILRYYEKTHPRSDGI